MNIHARQGTLCTAWRTFQRFIAAKRGAAALEFALIAPLMFAFYFLTMEFSQGIDANRKLGRVAIVVGDLVSQSSTVAKDELGAIMDIGEAVLQPYARSEPNISVVAIQISDDETPKVEVVWSWRLKNGSYGRVYPPGTEIKDVPKDLISADAFLIRAGAELSYKPVITWTDTAKKTLGLMAAFDSIEMGESYYLRPRVTRKISCSDC